MVATTSTLVNAFLANNFSEVGSRAPITPAQVPFTLPTAVTPSEESDQPALNDKREQQRQQQALLQQQARQQSFRDLAKPQVLLSPSDEADLFAAQVAKAVNASPLITQSSDLSDQANRTRRLALVGGDREKLSDVLQKRAQEAVATLYARNNNVVYNVTPIFSEAA